MADDATESWSGLFSIHRIENCTLPSLEPLSLWVWAPRSTQCAVRSTSILLPTIPVHLCVSTLSISVLFEENILLAFDLFLHEHLFPGLKCFAEEDSCSLKRFWGFIGQLLSLQFHISLKKCVHNSMMTRAVQDLIRSTLL